MVTENRDPVVEIELVVGEEVLSRSAVIDTGFNGYLSIPITMVQRSSWRYVGDEIYELANSKRR